MEEDDSKEEAKKHYERVFEDKQMADSVKHLRKDRKKTVYEKT